MQLMPCRFVNFLIISLFVGKDFRLLLTTDYWLLKSTHKKNEIIIQMIPRKYHGSAVIFDGFRLTGLIVIFKNLFYLTKNPQIISLFLKWNHSLKLIWHGCCIMEGTGAISCSNLKKGFQNKIKK
jgi:hypothetical protein